MNVEDIIAKNISTLRKEKNITQEELANNSNYTFQAVSRWENSKSLPNPVMLKRIADYFNVSIDYLYTEHDATISKDVETKLKRKEIIQKIILIFIFTFYIFGILGMIMGTLKLNGFSGFLWSSLAVGLVSFALSIILKKKIIELLVSSFLMWDIATCIFYQFDSGSNTLLLIFFFALIGQIFILLSWIFSIKRK